MHEIYNQLENKKDHTLETWKNVFKLIDNSNIPKETKIPSFFYQRLANVIEMDHNNN